MIYSVTKAKKKAHTVKWKFADYDGNGVIVVLGGTWYYKTLSEFLEDYNTGYDYDHLGQLLLKDRVKKEQVWRNAKFKRTGQVCNICRTGNDTIEVEEIYNGKKETVTYCVNALSHMFDMRTVKI